MGPEMSPKWLRDGSPEAPRSRGRLGTPLSVILGPLLRSLFKRFGDPLGDPFGLNLEVPVGLRLGVQWRSKRDSIFDRFPIILGSPGEPSWEVLGGQCLVHVRFLLGAPLETMFGTIMAPKTLSFSRPFSGPPRGRFFDNALEKGPISGGSFRFLWGYIFGDF